MTTVLATSAGQLPIMDAVAQEALEFDVRALDAGDCLLGLRDFAVY